MSYLYGKRFVGPITPTVLSLRKELYNVPYHEIDWNEARSLCAKVGQNVIFIHSNLSLSCKDTFLILCITLHSSLHLIENSGRNFDDVLKNLYL